MLLITCILLYVAAGLCQETIILQNISPKEGERVNVLESTQRIVFLKFNGTLYEDTLKGLNNLEQLIFQDSEFTEIEAGAFCSSPNVKSISLIDVEVEKLDQDSFKNCASVKELEIRYRDIPLEPNVFVGLENLEFLNTAQFNWNKLQKGDLAGLKNIKKIWLTVGSIASIEPGTFEGLDKLEELVLMNNKLTEVKGDEFMGLSSLQILNINYNPTTTINIDELLNNLPSLKKLSLSYALVPEDEQKEIQSKIDATNIEFTTL